MIVSCLQKLEQLCRPAAAVIVFTVIAAAGVTAHYPHGVAPTGLSEAQLTPLLADLESRYLSGEGSAEPDSMLHAADNGSVSSRTMGQVMLLCAYLDSDDATLSKLYNFITYAPNGYGLAVADVMTHGISFTTSQSALGADLDIALALDRAAIRWPDSPVDWDTRAQQYIRGIRRCFMNSDTLVSNDDFGVNFYETRVNAYPRLVRRTGDTRWAVAGVKSTALMVKSMGAVGTMVFPPTYVDFDGAAVNAETNDQWFGLRTWSVAGFAHAALQTNDAGAVALCERVTDFFATQGAEGDITNLATAYRFTDGSVLTAEPSVYTVGAAGVAAMAAGNQAIADNAAQWLLAAQPTDQTPVGDEAARLVYLLTMSGAFDIGDTTAGHFLPAVHSIDSPTLGQVYDEGATVTISGTVRKADYDIAAVYIHSEDSACATTIEGGSLSAQDSLLAFSYQWTPPSTGRFEVTIEAEDSRGRVSDPRRVALFMGDPLTVLPYTGTPIAIPGTIKAAHYDNGGEGVAYHDNEDWNVASQTEFRTDEGVDVEKVPDSLVTDGFPYTIGFTRHNPDTEWAVWTIDVTEPGTYYLGVTYAMGGPDRNGYFEIDELRPDDLTWQGTRLGETIVFDPATNGPYYFRDIWVENVTFDKAGVHRLRFVWASGQVNVKYIMVATEIAVRERTTPAAGATGRIFLRPVSNALTLRGFDWADKLTITDLAGQTLDTWRVTKAAERRPIGDLPAGTYIVRVTGPDRRHYTAPFTKTR